MVNAGRTDCTVFLGLKLRRGRRTVRATDTERGIRCAMVQGPIDRSCTVFIASGDRRCGFWVLGLVSEESRTNDTLLY